MDKPAIVRDKKIDVIRGIAIMFVLLIHITSDYAFAENTAATYWALNFFNKLFNTAVPTFVALTVFLGLKSGKRRGIGYLLKKTVPMILLYLAWSAVYLFVYTKKLGSPMPDMHNLIFQNLLQGSTCYHLYYIIMLLQLYILITVLSYLPVKKLQPRPWLPIAAIVAQLAVLKLFTEFIIMKYWFYNTSVLVIFYLTPICYGLMLAADKEKTEAMFKKYFPLYGTVFIAAALIRALLFAYGGEIFADTLLRSFVETAFRELFIFGGIPVMFRLGVFLRRLSPLELLGRHSLGIYFFHPLILIYIDVTYSFNQGSTALLLAGCIVKFIAVALISLIFSIASEYARKLFKKS